MRHDTVDLSGMGGDYEAECQRMLWRGVAYLKKIKPPLSIWDKTKVFQNVYGVLLTEGDGIKALESAVIPPGSDCTGAMHQCVMSHLYYIHAHGTEWWLEHVRQFRTEPEPDDFYVVDTVTGQRVGGHHASGRRPTGV